MSSLNKDMGISCVVITGLVLLSVWGNPLLKDKSFDRWGTSTGQHILILASDDSSLLYDGPNCFKSIDTSGRVKGALETTMDSIKLSMAPYQVYARVKDFRLDHCFSSEMERFAYMAVAIETGDGAISEAISLELYLLFKDRPDVGASFIRELHSLPENDDLVTTLYSFIISEWCWDLSNRMENINSESGLLEIATEESFYSEFPFLSSFDLKEITKVKEWDELIKLWGD